MVQRHGSDEVLADREVFPGPQASEWCPALSFSEVRVAEERVVLTGEHGSAQ